MHSIDRYADVRLIGVTSDFPAIRGVKSAIFSYHVCHTYNNDLRRYESPMSEEKKINPISSYIRFHNLR